MNGQNPPSATPDVLRIEDLDVCYRVGGHERHVLSQLKLSIGRGESYGLVGESGCGKSTAAFAAIRYLPRNGRVSNGRILIDGRDLMALSQPDLRAVRARQVSMVYQDPGRALNPTLRIGRQMSEVFESAGATRRDAEARALQMLARVQIPSPARVLRCYPHELSGGMQQRVVIAMALSTEPSLLILDEPTTGLDATVETQILDLLARLHAELQNSLLFISHSLSTIARMCDRVGVLYAGELVEEGPTAEVFAEPRHPYTVALLRCLPDRAHRKDQGRLATIPGFLPTPGTLAGQCVFAPRCGNATVRCTDGAPPLQDLGGRLSRCFYPDRATALPRDLAEHGQMSAASRSGHATAASHATAADHATAASDATATGHARAAGHATAANRATAAAPPLLRARRLSKTYVAEGRHFKAVHDVSLELCAGETLGLVGESGSGKSSLAKMLLGLSTPDAGGSVELDGAALAPRADARSPGQLKALQMIFQNAGSALNRAQTVRRLLGRSLRMIGLAGQAREGRLRDLAAAVRLAERHLAARPRQLSGGLQQRVGIARAFAGGPRIVVCDEPTSALDVSVQSAILNLLVELQEERRVSYLFISHDLHVVRYLADRVAVLYLGRIVQTGATEQVFSGPQHPYTEVLFSSDAAPRSRVARGAQGGEPPGAYDLQSGCVFHTRCPRKLGSLCETVEPALLAADATHAIRCHIPAAELARLQLKSAASYPEKDDPSRSAAHP